MRTLARGVESIVPKDETEWHALRVGDVTSTDAAALFGVSPYLTLFELWHRKRDKTIVQFEPTERMKWGTRLQDAIAAGIAEDQGWKIRRMDEYMRDPVAKMGASFDFAIGDDGILEIKNVDALAYRDGWVAEGDTVEAPPHIELQVQHQLAVSGRAYAYLGALVGGNQVVLVKREPDEKIIAAIRDTVAGFWESIDLGVAPKPDFSKDADFIGRLYGYAEPGKVLDASNDEKIKTLVERHRDLGAQAKEIETARDAVKAEILTMIGDAEKVKGDGFSITANLVGPAHVEFDRAGYRAFRVNWPRKAKKEVA